MAVPVHIEIRHFFHVPEGSMGDVIIKLKASLAEALEIYFPVAGIIMANENSESFIATDPANIRGAPFIVETKDFPFEQETEELSPRGGMTFLPPSSPTFAVKLSKVCILLSLDLNRHRHPFSIVFLWDLNYGCVHSPSTHRFAWIP